MPKKSRLNTERDIENNKRQRCILLGEYIVEHKSTVRDTACVFGVSKSTVHKDITEKLKKSDKELWAKVRKILEKNKQERHLRGGQATKKKYEEKRTLMKT